MKLSKNKMKITEQSLHESNVYSLFVNAIRAQLTEITILEHWEFSLIILI